MRQPSTESGTPSLTTTLSITYWRGFNIRRLENAPRVQSLSARGVGALFCPPNEAWLQNKARDGVFPNDLASLGLIHKRDYTLKLLKRTSEVGKARFK